MQVPVTDVTFTITVGQTSVPLGDGGVAWTIQVIDDGTLKTVFTKTDSNIFATATLPDGTYTAKGFRVNSIDGVVGIVQTVTFTITTTTELVDVATAIGHDYV